jgi:hypothetical protein
MCLACRGAKYVVQSVRWYTDSQRASMDKAAEKRMAAAEEKRKQREVKFAARNAFGFGEEGYITIYKNVPDNFNEWLHEHPIDSEGHLAAWYNNTFRWYTPSKIQIPDNLPEGIEPIRLNWDLVGINDMEMKSHEEVTALVDALIFEPSTSEYQGEVGTWLELPLTIVKNIEIENQYGISHMHIMEDADKNVYVWTTGSKSLEEGKTFNMKVKVKEHKEYKNVKQTIVWYCKIK